VAPSLDTYHCEILLGVDDGEIARIDASLAIQLSAAFLQEKSLLESAKTKCDIEFEPGEPFTLNDVFKEGLKTVDWPGRFQVRNIVDHVTVLQ